MLSVLVVRGKSMIASTLDVNGFQINSNTTSLSEEEMLDFGRQVKVRTIVRLGDHSTGKRPIVVGHLQHGSSQVDWQPFVVHDRLILGDVDPACLLEQSTIVPARIKRLQLAGQSVMLEQKRQMQ
uniref:Uncharacterized protein n=1 Tax=Anopheles farauti TaxID=69004 RepID=A0A182QGK8_9DIPT